MPNESECRDIILSEDYADIILEYAGMTKRFEETYKNYCPQPIGYKFGTLFYRLSDIIPLEINRTSYKAIPKIYGEMNTQAVEATGSIRLQQLPDLQLRGKDIIIGFVDSGIDYTHRVFRYSSGESRILSIWDQSGTTGNTPESYNYGTEYSQEDINEALRSDDPYSIVNVRDETGHGTIMAGAAAGNDDPENDFCGAAPEADIVVVKLKQAKKYLKNFYFIKDDAVAYQENDIMAGMIYLERVAARYGKPLVICLGIGTNQGDHSDTSYLATLINDLAGRAGFCVITPTGNEGNAKLHYQGTADNVEVRTFEVKAGRSFSMEIWGQPPDLLSVSITSPSGEVVPRIPARIGQSDVLTFLFERTVIYVDYRIVEQRSGAELILLRFENPSIGIWHINVYGSNIANGTFHAWLPIRQFVGENTYFISPEPNVTLTSPSDSKRAISVGGYDSSNGSFYINSGRGYTRSGIIKPDFTAPSVNVYVPLPGDGFGVRSGTSIGAALTAGAAAQLFEWGINDKNQPDMNSEDVKNFLIRGAERNPGQMYPDRQWGWGRMNVYNAFDILR